MKKIGIFLSVLVMVIGLSVSAHAALLDMNDGTIYDTDTQLSWVKNAGAGGLQNWANANAWVSSLNAGSGFAGLTGWRLPNADPACGINALNCNTSEMGHLYYTELQNPAGGPLTNTGPFTNLSVSNLQWTGSPAVSGMYYAFSFYSGTQYREYTYNSLYAWAVSPGARPHIQLPRTGQTTPYATDDDGTIQAGVVWPNPRFTVNTAAPDNSDTVTDNLTGLIWPKNVNFPSLPWQASLDYIRDMNLGINPNFGHTDWRLPTVNELQSLVNLEVPNQEDWLNAVGGYGNPFTNAHGYFYWSSTAAAANAASAWMVNMHYGDVNMFTRSEPTGLYFWPVRGPVSSAPAAVWETGQNVSLDTNTPPQDDGALQTGVAWPSPRYTDNGDGTVTDNLTGLIWLKNTNCTQTVAGIVRGGTGEIQWTDALTWSNGLASGLCGLTDSSTAGQWRLPNREELYSLIDFSTWGPSFQAGHPFLNLQSCGYWTSTTEADWTANAWAISFLDSDVNMVNKTEIKYAWPVRGGTVIPDTTPDAFTFTDQTGIALSTYVISDTITITGINAAAPVTIKGGTYSINGGTYINAEGTVNNGDTVSVRLASSSAYLSTSNARLTIGGVSDTFSVTTSAPNTPPTDCATNFTAGGTGKTVTFTDASHDAEGDATADVHVNWGDGSALEVGDLGASYSHTYASFGTYLITKTVRDDHGDNCSATIKETRTQQQVDNGTVGIDTILVTNGTCSRYPTVATTESRCLGVRGIWTGGTAAAFNYSYTVKQNNQTKKTGTGIAGTFIRVAELPADTSVYPYQVYLIYPTGHACTFTQGTTALNGGTVTANSCR